MTEGVGRNADLAVSVAEGFQPSVGYLEAAGDVCNNSVQRTMKTTCFLQIFFPAKVLFKRAELVTNQFRSIWTLARIN